MEQIHQIIQESVSGGFFRFAGYYLIIILLIGAPLRFIFIVINRILRHWNMRKHGYPPAHCDADGDFKEEKKTE